MVSVRRPPKSKQSSLFTVRNLILVFIAGQSLHLLSKIARQQQPDNNNDNNLPPPDIEIQKVPDDHPPSDDHNKLLRNTDTDDHYISMVRNSPADSDAAATTTTTTQQQKAALLAQQHQVLTKHGTGPTQLGFVVDLAYERQHASSFRPPESSQPVVVVANSNDSKAKVIAQQLHLGEKDAAALQACEYWSDEAQTFLQRPVCRDDPDTATTTTTTTTTRLLMMIAYNGQDFGRTICGQYVGPGQAVRLDDHNNCAAPHQQPVHVFASAGNSNNNNNELQDAPVDGHGMPAMVIQSQPGMIQNPSLTALQDVPCDIPCQFESSLLSSSDGTTTTNDRFVAGTDWKLVHSTSDPSTDGHAKVERTAFRRHEYYSTTSFQSSVPLSFYSFDRYNLRHAPAIDFDQAANRATYVLNDKCHAGTIRRAKWYAAVAAAYPTAAYGVCHHNTDLTDQQQTALDTAAGRMALMQQNRIVLAFEAGNDKDHITDIVWEALQSGAVPAILGASNAAEHLPPKAAIYTGSFNNWDKFAAFVKQVGGDRQLWESFQAWRTDQTALADFEKRYNFTRTPAECRTCRWAYALKYGLGWDHQQQVVRPNHLKRQLCVDESTQLATRPFVEVWGSHGGEEEEEEEATTTITEKCLDHSTSVGATIELPTAGVSIQRSVVHHDGVTDLHIHQIQGESSSSSSSTVVLRLRMAVRNTEGAYFRDTHTLVKSPRNPLQSSASIQDQVTKVTVLANWATDIISPEQGVVEVRVPVPTTPDQVRRIRIIPEDMSELHDKLTEFYPSPFGEMMTRDFVEPLELFYMGAA